MTHSSPRTPEKSHSLASQILPLNPSTAGFKLLFDILQSCRLSSSSCVSIHNVSAAEIRIYKASSASASHTGYNLSLTFGNGCSSMLITFVSVSARVAGMVPRPRYISSARWSFCICVDLKWDFWVRERRVRKLSERVRKHNLSVIVDTWGK